MGAESLAGMTVVVTGGTGFVGSAFVRRAIHDGAQVNVVARSASNHWRLEGLKGRYTTLAASLPQLAQLTLPGRAHADLMVHVAAEGVNQSFDDLDELVATNVEGTVQALWFALRNRIRRFVLIGSSGEYGPGENLDESSRLDPNSEYGATRAAATLLARSFAIRRGLDVVVVRPFAVYGPFEAPYRLIPYAILRGLLGEPIEISSGAQTRDYVHVDDVAEGIARASTFEAAANGIFNLCTGIQTPVGDAAALVARLTGAGSTVEKNARPPIPGEMWHTSGVPTLARTRLAWVPRFDLADGLSRTIDWFRSAGSQMSEYRSSLR